MIQKHTFFHSKVVCLLWIFVVLSSFHLGAVENAKSKTIVVLGDSIAAGYGLDATEAFPTLLQKKVDAEGYAYTVVNAGLSGDTTAGGARRIGWLLKRPMDVLVIELGGNDGLRGIAPEETRANLEKIIDLARGGNPSVVILLTGMQMPKNMGADYTKKFQEIYPTVAETKKVALVPFLLDGVGGKAELNQADRIHPNAAGHAIVAQTVWTGLKPLLQKGTNAPAGVR